MKHIKNWNQLNEKVDNLTKIATALLKSVKKMSDGEKDSLSDYLAPDTGEAYEGDEKIMAAIGSSIWFNVDKTPEGFISSLRKNHDLKHLSETELIDYLQQI
jgi:hypothetical protein